MQNFDPTSQKPVLVKKSNLDPFFTIPLAFDAVYSKSRRHQFCTFLLGLSYMVAGLVIELLFWLSLVLLGPGRLDYVDLPFIISILIGIVEKEKGYSRLDQGVNH
jgi:hypothetical protein